MLTAAFDRSQREAEARAGVPEERQGRAVAAQVALARRESPHRGRQHVGLAVVLDEMPHTKAAFRSGGITEWRAMLLARETACLSRADRAEVDRRVAGDPDVLEGMGDGEIVAAVRELAYELDPVSFVERRRRAEADRRVSLRPAPDVMSQLSTLLPVKDGVAVWAVLSRDADVQRAAGDQRSRGQIMADTLVRRDPEPRGGRPFRAAADQRRRPRLGAAGGRQRIRLGGALRPGARRPAPRVDRRERRAGRRPVGAAPLRHSRHRRAGGHGLRSRVGSRAHWPTTCGCATDAAALASAAPRSATSTTPRPTPTAVRPARPTGRGSANTATTPRMPSAGQHGRDPDRATPSRP